MLRALAHYRALPADLAQGELKNWAFPILTRVARPEQARTSAADLWQALGGKPKTALNYKVTVAVASLPDVEAGPPVTDVSLLRKICRT